MPAPAIEPNLKSEFTMTSPLYNASVPVMLPSAIRTKPPLIPEYHIYIAGILSWIAR